MKKIAATLIIVLAIILMIPTFSMAADFWCKNTTKEECKEKCGKSLGGIFHQMKKNGSTWLTSTGVKGSGYGIERSPSEARDGQNSTIEARGGLCFGHATSDNSKVSTVTVGAIIDTSETKGSYNEHLLAYWVWYSTKENELGSNGNGKNRIRKWAQTYYKDYGGILQSYNKNEHPVKDFDTAEAKAYANGVKNRKLSSTTTDAGSQTITYKDGYTFIGPYNLTFKYGKMQNAELTKEGGATVTIKKYSTSVSTTNLKNLTDLTSYDGNSFYFAYEGTIDSVKNIKLTQKVDIIDSRTVLSHSPEDGGQNVGIFYGKKSNKSITLTLKGVSKSSLEITKKDEETGTKLANIGFVVHCKNQGYVKSGSPATYVSNISNATIFKTGTDGKVKIENLPKAGKYTIYEVINPNNIYESVSVDNPKNLGSTDITLGGDFKYTANNKRNVGDLEIVKKDEETDKALSGIKFVVYCDGKGYVKSGSPATYVSSVGSATKFTTDSNGKVTVSNILRDKKYTIYEVENPYYEYEVVSTTNAKNLGTVTLSVNKNNNYKLTHNVTNKRTVADIEIVKKDKETGKAISGVKFVVHCEGKGYVVEGEPATYVSSIGSASKFTTGNDGKAKVANLLRNKKYTIYEVENPYYIYKKVSLENPENVGTVTLNVDESKNYTVTYDVTNERIVADIEIVKKDEETGKELSGVKFIVECKGKGYVVEGEPATYTSDKNKATKYTTGNNGKITVENILRNQKYTIYEVENPYYIYKKVSLNEPENVGTVELKVDNSKNYKLTHEVTNKRIVADIEILKIDVDTRETLSEIEFVVYCGGTGFVVDGEPATYTSNIENATKYKTDSKGKVTVKNVLRDRSYTVYEVGNPYYIYEKVSIDNPKDLGSVRTTTDNTKDYKVSFTGENDQIVAHIDITKVDKETKEKLSGIGFVAYLPGQGFVKEKKNDLSTYVSDIKDATIYYTGNDGKTSIRDLPIQGTYKIYEVDNPYYQYLEATLERPMDMGNVKVTDFTTFTVTLENQPVPLAELIITKIDEDSKKPMAGVGFIVHCPDKGGYLKDGLPATYVKDKKDATIYRTDKNGEVVVGNIRYEREYTIYEVENPNFGYEEVSLEKPKQLSTVTVVRNEQVTKTYVTETNKRLYIKVSGFVWENIDPSGKFIQTDNVWEDNSEDKRLNNVTVTLKKSNGAVIDSKETTVITNSEGKQEEGAYLFGDYQNDPKAKDKKVLIEDLAGAYIEFEYNGMCYKSIPVELTKANGSKATDDKLRSAFNASYATISKDKAQSGNYNLKYDYKDHVSTLNYGGQYKYGYQGQKYPISGIDKQYLIIANTKDAAPNKILAQDKTINDILKEGIEEIKNINLGVAEREMPDMAVVEDIENVKISLNGYDHTYKYAQRFENQVEYGDGFNVAVKFGSKYSSMSYTREVYASDVSYNASSGNEGKLEVYITYKVALKNEATSVYTKVNEIMNYYDQRYTIDKVYTIDENDPKKENAITEIGMEELQSGYKVVKIRIHQDVETQKQKDVYIRYKLNNDAINSLLNEEPTLNSITEITAYSSYDDVEFKNAYAGVDRDSAPNNAKAGDNTTYEDDTDQAPSLILKLKEGRNVEGTVFEDAALVELLNKTGNERERKGNGIYDSNENVIKNVKVELLTKDASNNYVVANLYQIDGGTEKIVKAKTVTGADGSYKLAGIIPGEYFVRFTYADISVIYDSNGNEVKNVDITEYKSTIFRGGSSANTELDWYATDTIRYSDAKDTKGMNQDGTDFDIVAERTTSTEINYKEALEDEKLKSIEANTNNFEILMEYDVNKDKISPYGEQLKFVFGNVDLGIIERPKQDMSIRKEIAYIELALANGQIIISGDPRGADIMQYVQKLGPNSHIKIEMDDELMQGATLKVKYEIIVDTTGSEIDYNDKNYYYYGTPSNSTAYKVISVTRLLDYLSDNLRIDSTDPENNGWEEFEVGQSMVDNGYMSQDAYNAVKKYKNILSTEKFKGMGIDEIRKVPIIVSTTLSKEDELVFGNHVEANILTERKMKDSIPGNYDPANSSPDEDDDDNREITITPITGENRNYLPHIIIGVTSFLILILGIVIIKKKVTRK